MLRGHASQTEFAAKFGLKQAVYSHYETGRREPDLESLCLIAKISGVTTDWLLGLSDDKNGNENKSVNVSNNKESVAINSHNGGDCAHCPLAKAAGLFLSKKSKK